MTGVRTYIHVRLHGVARTLLLFHASNVLFFQLRLPFIDVTVHAFYCKTETEGVGDEKEGEGQRGLVSDSVLICYFPLTFTISRPPIHSVPAGARYEGGGSLVSFLKSLLTIRRVATAPMHTRGVYHPMRVSVLSSGVLRRLAVLTFADDNVRQRCSLPHAARGLRVQGEHSPLRLYIYIA